MIAIRQVGWVTTSRLLSRGSLVATSIILARNLDVQAFAAFSYFLLTISMLAVYASMGLGVTTNRYFVMGDNPNAQQSKTIAAIVAISVVFSIALVLVVIILPERLLVGEFPIPRWAMALGVFAFSLGIVPQNALAGLEKYRQDAFLSVLSGGFVLGLAVYAAKMQSLELAMIALIGGSIIRVVGGAVIVIRAIGWHQILDGFPFSKSDAARVFSFSLPMFLVSLLASTGPWVVGKIILNGDGSTHAFALYAIGLQWFALGMFLPASVSRISMPRLVRSIDNPRDEDPVKSHLIFGLKLSVLSSVTVFIFGLVFSQYIMMLYGNNYSADKWFLGGFLFVAVLASGAQMIGILIVVSNHQWGWLKINVAFLLTMVFVAIKLMNWGAWAGPVSFIVAYLVLLALGIYYVERCGLVRSRAKE